jgi:hypothetical protein
VLGALAARIPLGRLGRRLGRRALGQAIFVTAADPFALAMA